jgi:hypothetical protein
LILLIWLVSEARFEAARTADVSARAAGHETVRGVEASRPAPLRSWILVLFNLSAGSLPQILEVSNLALADIRQRLS